MLTTTDEPTRLSLPFGPVRAFYRGLILLQAFCKLLGLKEPVPNLLSLLHRGRALNANVDLIHCLEQDPLDADETGTLRSTEERRSYYTKERRTEMAMTCRINEEALFGA